MAVTANCICEIHCLALDGLDLNTVHKLSSKEKKNSVEPGFEPGTFGREAWMLPLCYAVPPLSQESVISTFYEDWTSYNPASLNEIR